MKLLIHTDDTGECCVGGKYIYIYYTNDMDYIYSFGLLHMLKLQHICGYLNLKKDDVNSDLKLMYGLDILYMQYSNITFT